MISKRYHLGITFSFSFNPKRGKMYRQGLTSISIPQSIYVQLVQQITAYCTIESITNSTQTLIFSTVRPIGFLYKQIDGRTVLRLATRQQINEQINEVTGEVRYFLTLENSYRFGKPPTYVISGELELTAAQYGEYLSLTPYDSFHRKETIFTDKSSKKRYSMVETTEGNVITFTQYSNSVNDVFELPEYIKAVIYAEGDKYEREAVNTQAKWREKQEADIAAKKAAIQAKKDAEAAERKRKAAEKKAAAKKAKTLPKATKKTTKNDKPKPQTSKPATEKKREENISDMWSNWAKGK